MIVSRVLSLAEAMSAELTGREGVRKETRTSASCFPRLSACFSAIPSLICFDALLCSFARTDFSPFPSFECPANSCIRPASAFLRCAGVRLSSGFATPDRSCVWTSRCKRASFCVLFLSRRRLLRNCLRDKNVRSLPLVVGVIVCIFWVPCCTCHLFS